MSSTSSAGSPRAPRWPPPRLPRSDEEITRMTRRLSLLLLAALVMGATLPAAGAEPIRIGVLGPLTGGAAVIGTGEVNGIKLRLKQLDNKLGGRPVELIVEDDAGDPTTGLTKAQKLEIGRAHV